MSTPFNVIFAPVERLLLLSSCSLHLAYFVSGSPQMSGCELAQGPCEVKLLCRVKGEVDSVMNGERR